MASGEPVGAVHHLALRVADVERALGFYAGVLGLPELRRFEEPDGRLRSAWLQAGPLVLMLEHRLRGAGPEAGSGHVLVVTRADDGRMATIRARDLDHTELVRPDPREPWRLQVSSAGGVMTISGDAGLHVAGKLLALLNGGGATEAEVRYAVAKLEDAGNPEGYFARVAAIAMRCSWGRFPDALPRSEPIEEAPASEAEKLALQITKRSFWGRGGIGSEPRTPLPRLPLVDRLALEMAANEDVERRALEGELSLLESAWKGAEGIAAIADRLFLDRGRAEPLPLSAG